MSNGVYLDLSSLVLASKPLFHLSFLYWQAIALEDWVDEQVRERMQSPSKP